MNDLKEQLNERKLQVEELQLILGKREEELAQSMMKIDEEGAGRLKRRRQILLSNLRKEK